MSFQNTGHDDLASVHKNGSLWKHAKGLCAQALLLLVSICGGALFFHGHTSSQPKFVEYAQHLFFFVGAVQILLGVYLSTREAKFLTDLIVQEGERPTKFVREVDLTRALLGLSKRLQMPGTHPASTTPNLQVQLAAAIAHYTKKELKQRSPMPSRLQLTQADIARGLLTASSFTVCGTLLVIAGMLIQIFSKTS